ncbi:MAG: hypothetical protein KC680_01340 [Candidatus Peregrinibacteria bacterium]|nr:hypothetical protein [Candidatus Peregrinibacteria bacterium]MCB9808131.1 hypothetical protein [Candidatus Peribacteria bacterium]
MPISEQYIEQMKTMHPDALEALQEAAWDRGFAQMGLREESLDTLLAFIDTIGKDESVLRFTLHHARALRRILQEAPNNGETQMKSIEAIFDTGPGQLHTETIIKEADNEKYTISFKGNVTDKVAALRLLSRWAVDPQYSFRWRDAAILSQKIRLCS